jgi:hypothetical protein
VVDDLCRFLFDISDLDNVAPFLIVRQKSLGLVKNQQRTTVRPDFVFCSPDADKFCIAAIHEDKNALETRNTPPIPQVTFPENFSYSVLFLFIQRLFLKLLQLSNQ